MSQICMFIVNAAATIVYYTSEMGTVQLFAAKHNPIKLTNSLPKVYHPYALSVEATWKTGLHQQYCYHIPM